MSLCGFLPAFVKNFGSYFFHPIQAKSEPKKKRRGAHFPELAQRENGTAAMFPCTDEPNVLNAPKWTQNSTQCGLKTCPPTTLLPGGTLCRLHLPLDFLWAVC